VTTEPIQSKYYLSNVDVGMWPCLGQRELGKTVFEPLMTKCMCSEEACILSTYQQHKTTTISQSMKHQDESIFC